jgi:hypothetical protein
MDKYDEAIAFLKGVDPGSYFDECAELMEELLAKSQPKKRQTRQQKAEDRAWMERQGHAARYYARAKGLL